MYGVSSGVWLYEISVIIIILKKNIFIRKINKRIKL